MINFVKEHNVILANVLCFLCIVTHFVITLYTLDYQLYTYVACVVTWLTGTVCWLIKEIKR